MVNFKIFADLMGEHLYLTIVLVYICPITSEVGRVFICLRAIFIYVCEVPSSHFSVGFLVFSPELLRVLYKCGMLNSLL